MMKLPTYTDPNPTIKWLRDEQARLRAQADKMMAELLKLSVSRIAQNIVYVYA
jgi:hypothetical protein